MLEMLLERYSDRYAVYAPSMANLPYIAVYLLLLIAQVQ